MLLTQLCTWNASSPCYTYNGFALHTRLLAAIILDSLRQCWLASCGGVVCEVRLVRDVTNHAPLSSNSVPRNCCCRAASGEAAAAVCVPAPVVRAQRVRPLRCQRRLGAATELSQGLRASSARSPPSTHRRAGTGKHAANAACTLCSLSYVAC